MSLHALLHNKSGEPILIDLADLSTAERSHHGGSRITLRPDGRTVDCQEKPEAIYKIIKNMPVTPSSGVMQVEIHHMHASEPATSDATSEAATDKDKPTEPKPTEPKSTEPKSTARK
jgi:hypothetical protein